MEAASLKPKKQLNKGKLKKTMKHVICRPDKIFWPQTSVDEGKLVTDILNKFKLDIPEFKKPLWCELKQIPKELRPKPLPIPKVEGLIFGIAECQKAIEVKECSGVLIESTVNPKTIVQPLIDSCYDKCVPVLCLKELRKIAKSNFGIPTTVLGVKQHCLSELEKNIVNIYKNHKSTKRKMDITIDEEKSISTIQKEELMDIKNESLCPYLYRTNKKNRVFTPPQAMDETKSANKFEGQNFIELPKTKKQIEDRKQFMKMIVKKISSNPNRKNVKIGSKNKSKDFK